MFTTPYDYIRLGIKQIEYKGGVSSKEHRFRFNCKVGHSYIVIVEEYHDDFFAIKFHLRKDKNRKDKYNIITKHNDVPRILGTCIKIMLDFYTENKHSSFGFIGAHSASESENNTKRFRLYRRVMEDKFSDINFQHIKYTEKSAYLMLNRAKANSMPELLRRLEETFELLF